MSFSRREFLKISALSFSSLVISTSFSACGNTKQEEIVLLNDTDVDFLHGVASGDPLSDKVIIWTRLTPSDKSINELNLSYELTKTKDFTKIERVQGIKALKENDYTVKIDLQDLEENTTYYYRFKSNNKVSLTGKTKTLAINPSEVKMAVFSCSNYTNGYFNAYMEASKDEDLDVVLHLGDYIYEYGMTKGDDGVTPAYATANAQTIGRVLASNNDKELFTLDDYRKRYALYHKDEGSLALHKNVPFITVWDDHEIANDTYNEGAQNHDDSEGDFTLRKEAALKAYFEWLPIRPINEGENEKIFRSFDFGNLLSLHMLDTRVIGRSKQLSYSKYFDAQANFNQALFLSDMNDNTRTLLGSEQLNDLQSKLANSTAKWQVLGQQVLMGKMYLPAELLVLISQLEAASGPAKIALLSQMNTKIAELVAIKTRILQNDPSLSNEEKSRITTALPYNLDAWDGYSLEREILYASAKNLDKKLIVLAGDTHNSWANDLKDQSGDNIGVEFATSSVSSPGMEDYAALDTMQAAQAFENAISLLIDDLKYTNLNQRGFLNVRFTLDNVEAKWQYINSNNSKSYTLDQSREKILNCSDKNIII